MAEAAKSGESVKRKVQVLIDIPLKAAPLNDYINLMKALNVEVSKLQKNLTGLSTQAFRPQQVQNMISKVFAQEGRTAKGTAAVAKMFGFTEGDVKNFASGIRRAMNAAGEFTSLTKAREVMTGMLKTRTQVTQEVLNNIRSGVGTTIAPAQLGKNAADLLTAEIGKMSAAISNAISGRNAQGQFTATSPVGPQENSGGEGRGRRRGKGGALMKEPAVPGHPGEIGRTVTQTADYTKTVVRQQKGMDKVVATTFDELMNEIKTVTTTTAGKGAMENAKHAEAMVKESLRGEKGGLRKGDILGLANLQEAAAGEFEKLLTEELKGAIGPDRFGKFADRVRSRAAGLRNSAGQNRKQALRDIMSGATFYDVVQTGDETHGQALRDRAFAEEVERAHIQNLRRKQQRAFDTAKQAGTPPVVPPPEIPEGGGAGKPGFLGTFARNTGKVAMWSASVGALYTSMDVAKDAMKTVVETELQTQRLGQVFRGVGGSAKELTVDVLGLAAAEGRSRDEALESAISWSRLGLTRRQVNEAVRESLVASNVAEIDAAEATEKLQAIMASYGLQVNDLHGLLGQLNETSNTFNVTNKDMLQGLTRTASVAKQAGVPLPELIGMLAAGVGTTGQTGANMGNAIKSIMVSLNDPNIQKFLRNQYHMEVTQNGGREMKPMNEVFSELFVKYQGMNSGQRQMLLQQVAGKTQASRMAAVLDSYVKGQVLAIEAQKNLNSAEEENARIKDSLISKVRSLRSEWDKLLVTQGQNSGLTGIMSNGVSGASSALRMVNRFGNIPYMVNPLLSQPSVMQRMDQFVNWAFPSDEDVEARRLSGLNRRQQEAAGTARSGGMAVNLYDTLKQSLRVSTDPGKLLDQVSELHGFRNPDLVKNLRTAVGGKNFGEVDRLLTKEQGASREQVMAARAREAAAIEEAKAYLTQKSKGATGEKKADYETQLRQLENRKEALIKEFVDDDALGKWKEATLDGLKHTEKTRVVLQQISDIYRSMPTATAGQRLELEEMGLGEQEKYLTRRIDGLEAVGLNPPEKARVNKELEDQRNKVKAEMAAVTSPEALSGARRLDRANVASTMAGAAADRFTFGAERVDQLQNRIAGVQKLLQAREALSRNAGTELERENAMVEAQTLRTELVQSQLELERERGRLMQTEFEYARKLLTAGPQELMTRLFANRLLKQSGGGMNAGQFFGFSPETRAALLEEEQSRRRQEFLKRSPSTLEMQRTLGLADNLVGGGNFGGARLNAVMSGAHGAVADAANSAAVDLGALSTSANGASAAISDMKLAVADFLKVLREANQGGVTGGWEDKTGTGAPWLGQVYG